MFSGRRVLLRDSRMVERVPQWVHLDAACGCNVRITYNLSSTLAHQFTRCEDFEVFQERCYQRRTYDEGPVVTCNDV